MVVTVDDRFLLFALDRLYRKAMKAFECTTLLRAARRVAGVLDTDPLNVPPEGYYATDPALTEYFRFMRALQEVPESREPAIAGLPEFSQLWDVVNSPIYGRPERLGKLFPRGKDPLGQALGVVAPHWTIAQIVPTARRLALEADDYSLVGLAARVEDPVLLTALRESVVLYAQWAKVGLPPPPTFEWKVNPDLARQANRFVQAFNTLIPDALPAVTPENAPLFYEPGWHVTQVAGRCVRLGIDPGSGRHYHWAICRTEGSDVRVQEFWSDDLWTTERYLKQTHEARTLQRSLCSYRVHQLTA